MINSRIKIRQLLEQQIPSFLREDNPEFLQFLTEYFKSAEIIGGPLDILNNIDQYVKLDNIGELIYYTDLTTTISFADDELFVQSTEGFPNSYGLVQIDDEIIFYESKTKTSFINCSRGFSGITSYRDNNNDSLVFSDTVANEHQSGVPVYNLANLFLKELYKKFKVEYAPGFDNINFYEDVNEKLLISKLKDFYSSKGAIVSFKILFKALYNVDVEIIKPQDQLIKPSDGNYRITRDLVVEVIEGDPQKIINLTLFQDQTPNIQKASGTITKVEKIYRGENEYYQISLDYNPDNEIFNFTIHPKTKLLSSTDYNKKFLNVDSTLGFPSSGTLVSNINGVNYYIDYSSKSSTQFLDCSGTIPILAGSYLTTPDYAYCIDSDKNLVKLRVTGVLSDISYPKDTYFYKEDDIIDIISLGSNGKTAKHNDWIFNISPSYNVNSIVQLTSAINGAARFRIITTDENIFFSSDIAELSSNTGKNYSCTIIERIDLHSFDANISVDIDLNSTYIITKKINTANCLNFVDVNINSTDVQNVYIDKDDTYITSNSLPSYLNSRLSPKEFKVSFTGEFDGEFLDITSDIFYTGDAVYYQSGGNGNSLNIPDGVYFIKKDSESRIKLSTSRTNIFNSIFVYIFGSVVNNTLTLIDYYNKPLKAQELVRKIGPAIDDGNVYNNNPGKIGILKNGVEILSYKSNDFIFYGELKNISVSANGNDYDVINPPILHIQDPVGHGATGVCHVNGSLKRINIINSGFDFIEEPKVTIFGGNGFGAKAKCKMTSVFEISKFNSSGQYNKINLNDNTIGFTTYHKFRSIEKVIYLTKGQIPVEGLVDNSTYYLKNVNSTTIKLFNNYDDAFAGINTINLTNYGVGVHKLQSYYKKQIISSVEIISSGENYTNKKLFFNPSDVNIYTNSLYIKDHGYLDKEVVNYTSSETLITGISSTSNYYVKVLDKDNIRLSLVGIGTDISQDYYYNNNQYTEFLGDGSGVHELNYLPITVTIEGPTGILSTIEQNFQPIIQPIFRGSIQSVSLSNFGTEYGMPDIINYNRQPLITVLNGYGALLTPIVDINGSIIDVLIDNSGQYYNSPPNLIINGSGFGCILTPIISNGNIVDIKIINRGSGYSKITTNIEVISAGSGVKFESTSTFWTINGVERLISNTQISPDDGVLTNSLNPNYGLQYCHSYVPRKFREKILSYSLGQNGEPIYRSDFLNDTLTLKYHSPLIGWAYDGNPIYGPYGYANREGGVVKRMISGYKLQQSSLRPPMFNSGIFVEDYVFVGDGDLDIHNGRYCKTPEFPNGTYAYFSTINENVESSGPFRGQLKPQFPYFIGNYFKSKIDQFNFKSNSNQKYIDLNSTGWFRNTYPYGLLKNNTFYTGVIQPNNISKSYSYITSVSEGSVDNLSIVFSGDSYKVKDKIFFNNENTGGSGAYAEIKSISGKNSIQINYEFLKIPEVQIINYANNNAFIGISSSPHVLSNKDNISIRNLSIDGSQLNDTFEISLKTNILKLSKYVPNSSITGIITYFSVLGNLNYPSIFVNDILGIGTEQVKVLNIDSKQSRIRVRREHNSTIGISHSEGIDVTEFSRKFYFNSGFTTSIQYKLNTEFYFNPKDTLGIGSVGIGTTITFSNPGVGITEIFVPYKSIFIPGHRLNTGDNLIYKTNSNTPIRVSTATSTYNLQNDTNLYVAKFSDDLIGISTVKIGIGTDGNFVGITTTAELLTFRNLGTGFDHSLITNFKNNLQSDIFRKSAKITTQSNHNLLVGDKISVNVIAGIQTTIFIEYNDFNRRMVVNPKYFSNLNVNIENNTITLQNHGYISGEKIIHTSTTPCGGLIDQKIYYIIVVDENTIKLSNTYYKTINLISNLDIVEITSASFGTLLQISPQLNVVKYSTIIFDLTSPTLSANSSPSFNFNLYTDSKFTNKFLNSKKNSSNFNVQKIGTIGVSNNAKLILTLDEYLPTELYYNLEPIYFSNNSISKINLINDDFNISNKNKLNIINSKYYKDNAIVTGITTNTISYSIDDSPERNLYTNTQSIINYSTTSNSASGPIHEVLLQSKGRRYNSLPSISKIVSGIGSNAICLPLSKNIGKIEDVKIADIGFDYPSDMTLTPKSALPKTFKIEPLTKFKSIDIVTPGVNYYIPPKLIVIDGFTGRVNSEVDIRYNIGDTQVSIIRNSTGFYNITPYIIPTSNSNGIRINDITYDSETYDVTVGLAVTYSTSLKFPFYVGGKILIENTNVILSDDKVFKGYNSSNYNYKLFVVTEITPNIGISETFPTIKFNLLNYLNIDEDPGIFDNFESFGTVTPESYFPVFNPTLEKSFYFDGEEVGISSNITGIVQSYDKKNEYLKITSRYNFNVNDLVVGKTSGNKGIISEIFEFDSSFKIGSNSITKKGWQSNTGALNDFLQRIHDNDYYQYFSYSIKSPIEYNVWNPIVKSLSHTTGFKKFGSLMIDSYNLNSSGISTEQIYGSSSATTNIISEINLNSIKDFDVATEKSVFVDTTYVSNEILFKLPFLQKYKEFIGNRVLPIDDISYQFNNNNLNFNLYSNNYPIFKINFSNNNINLLDNIVQFDNHYFVSGEELEYIPHNNNFTNAIGISTVTIPGIGLTDKLPQTVYAIKLDSQKIQFASIPDNALFYNPIPLKITSVGIGSTHALRSKNQNSRALITINNMIQSPVVSTAITTNLPSSVGIGTTIFSVSGISSIFGGDLIKIDNEIMKIISVGVSSENSINVLRSWMGTFESSHSANSLVTKLSGNYNIVDSVINFIEPIWGNLPVGYGTTAPTQDEIDYLGITTNSIFNGRVFLRSALTQGFTTNYTRAYDTNYIFDDISQSFTGLSTQFTLKQNKTDVTGISGGNAIILINDIFQGPQRLGNSLTDIKGDYKLTENSGQTTLNFTENISNLINIDDINKTNIPKGGILVSVGSTSGLGYQPLISAGGTAIVSSAGTIQSISIGNSGSGYRVGIQTYIKVGVQTYSSGVANIKYIGFASASNGNITSVTITNPGIGYTISNPPLVVFDDPLSYTNIPLIYSSKSSLGIGTGATIDIVVGQGSSVINFELKNLGYGYGLGEILTIPYKNSVGIPTDKSIPYEEFNIFVDQTYNSKFSGWSVGDFLILDDISKYFNGYRKLFPLSRNGERLSFFAKQSSGIDLQSNLLVFINDVLQIPGKSYVFTGGSILRFVDAPKGGIIGLSTLSDRCKLCMYTGTQTIDVREVETLETVKTGDDVQLYSDIDKNLTEEKRLVVDVTAADSILTNNYSGGGVTGDELFVRPISWTKQTEDKIINEIEIGKDRVYYEPSIYPCTYLLDNVGIGSTYIFVNSLRSFFDDPSEGLENKLKNSIEILTQEELISASANSVVSVGGTISEIIITNPGIGYTSNPEIIIQSSQYNSVNNALGISSINNLGIIASIQVSAGGTGYFYGPIQNLSITQQGSNFPNLTLLTNTFVNARLKTKTGIGLNATANIEINPNNSQIITTEIVNGGYNYQVGDQIFVDTFDNVGLASTQRNVALTNQIIFTVSSIQSPIVLIQPPSRKKETIFDVNYTGDYGLIIGIGTTNVGIATGITFDFYIPQNSVLRSKYSIYNSGISTGYYFTIENSSVGYGATSLRKNNTILGISTICLDNIYEVIETKQIQKFIPSAGITTTIIRVTSKIANYNGFVGIGTTDNYGTYSWGKINIPIRISPISFSTASLEFSKLSSNPIIRRTNPLKYFGYYV